MPEKTIAKTALESQKLNIGCKNNLRKGWLNVDEFSPQADLCFSFDSPENWEQLKSDWFEEISVAHALENSRNTVGFLQNLYRVCRPNASITLVTPHYSNLRSEANLYHNRIGLGTLSFEQFNEKHFQYYHTGACFKVQNVRLRFKGFWKFLLEPLANRAKITYELWFSRFFPIEEIEFKLLVVKPEKSEQ